MTDNDLFDRIKQKAAAVLKIFSNLTAEAVIVRILTAWTAMGAVQKLFGEGIAFTEAEFFRNFYFVKCLAIFAVIFSLLCLPFFDNKIKYFLFASSFLMFTLTLPQRTEFGYCIGAVLIMILVSAYCFKDIHLKKDVPPIVTYGAAFLAGTFIVAFISIVTVLSYKAFWSPNYDFGIFSQMYYYMKETFAPMATCERDRLLSHFAVHFSPIYYLLLPVYFVFPSPVTLLVLQGIISASGVIPLILIAKRCKLSNLCAGLLSVSYLLMPAIIGGNLYYLHENVFLTPLLLWTFYFADKNKPLPATIFAFLVMFVKEDAPVYIMFFGIYLLISGKNRKLGAMLTVLAAVYFAVVIGCIEKFGEGAMFGRFDNFSRDGKPASMIGVILTVFRNPAYFVSECFQNDKIEFFLQMFLPVLFIPFMTKKYSRFILLGPTILINLMPDYAYQHNMGYQYVFGAAAFIIYLTAVNAADMDRTKCLKILIPTAAAAVLVFSSKYYSRFRIIEDYRNNAAEHTAISQALEHIPDDASVAASTFMVANLSQREEVYELETTKQQAEYYVLDLRVSNEKYSVEYFREKGYQQVCVNKYVAVFRDPGHGQGE